MTASNDQRHAGRPHERPFRATTRPTWRCIISYPAYDQLPLDIGRGFAIWRVYMHLRPPRLDFREPSEVKVWSVAMDLKMSERKVRSAITWLVARGYLKEHSRGSRRVRSLTIAWAVDRTRPSLPAA